MPAGCATPECCRCSSTSRATARARAIRTTAASSPRRSTDLQQSDLVPYRTLSSEAPVGVMVGHLQVPGLTGSDPASLSPAAYGLLRSGGYGGPPFNGPVFTDDLSGMAGDHRSLRRRRGRAARAGGRRGHRAVDHHRRGARGAGPVGEGAGGGRADDARRGRLGVADGRGEGPESAVRTLKALVSGQL